MSPTGGSTTFSGLIAGGGTLGSLSLVMSGTGSQNLAGANTYTGGTTVASGTLQLGNASALGSSTAALAVNGGLLDLNGFSPAIGALNGGGTINDVVAGGAATLTVGSGGASGAFSGTILNASGTVSLLKTGGGLESLAGAQAYTGSTTIPRRAPCNSATARPTARWPIPRLPTTLRWPSTSGPPRVSGSIGGGGALAKVGTGLLTLTGSNSYGGATSVTTGSLGLVAGSFLATLRQSGGSRNNGQLGDRGLCECRAYRSRTAGWKYSSLPVSPWR